MKTFSRRLVDLLVILLSMIVSPINTNAAEFGPGSGIVAVNDGSGRYRTTFDIHLPATVTLHFNFCDPQTCTASTNPDSTCRAGRYFATFLSDVMGSLSITSPLGVGVGKVFYTDYQQWGPASGKLDATPNLDILDDVKSRSNGVDLHFANGAPGPLQDFTNLANCGVDETTAKALGGTKFTNLATHYRITIIWNAFPGAVTANLNQEQVKSQSSITTITPPSTSPLSYSQSDSRWANTPYGAQATLEQKGTVPTILASALSAYGSSSTPAYIAGKLKTAVDAQGQTQWPGMIASLSTFSNIKPSEVDLRNALTRLEVGQPVVAALTAQGQEQIILLKSYDANKDQFLYLDARNGRTYTMNWTELTVGNPWFLAIN